VTLGESFPASQTAALRGNSTNAFPLTRAGFWIRAVASLIDLALLVVPFAIFVSLLAAVMGISNSFFFHRQGTPPNETLAHLAPLFLTLCVCFFAGESWLYFALTESSRWHATLGKRLLGLYVADTEGKRIDFWRASLRFCCGRLLVHVPILGGYYFALDCLCIGLIPGKSAIHDLLSGCRVFREGDSGPRIR